MKPLIIEATESTPAINFDPQNEIFSLKGNSLPENAIKFYKHVLEWFNNYVSNPNNITTVDFRFEYLSSSSSKQIARLLMLLKDLSDTTEVVVRWHYEKGDMDMQKAGLRYVKYFGINFDMIEY